MPMNNVNNINSLKKHRLELIEQLEALVATRTDRSAYISKDLNSRIFKLEKEIHELTLKHRNEIKKFYSAANSTHK